METKEINLIHLKDLTENARRAFYWQSQDPEGRGLRTLRDFENTLIGDLETIPEQEHEVYIATYKKVVSIYLSAESKCASSFVTGGENFNVRKAENASKYAMKTFDNFNAWRNKALKAINKKTEVAKSPEEKEQEIISLIKEDIKEVFKEGNGSYFYNNLYNRIEKFAYKGMVNVIREAVDEVVKQNDIYNRITTRHKFFRLVELAQKHEIRQDILTSSIKEVKGVRIISNQEIDRLQLLFDGKPSNEIISLLKKNAFRWSPSNKAWQRQLTPNALHAAKNIINSLD